MGYKHNKEDILNIGYNILRKNGYHNVGINQILKEANLPKGSFYNFFETKEDFAQQVIQHYGEWNTQWITSFFENDKGTPLEMLKTFYQALFDMNEKDDYAGGCLVNNMNMEVGRNNDTLAEEVNTQYNKWMRVLSDIVEKGQAEGQIKTNHSPLEWAEFLHQGFYGALSRTKVVRSRKFLDAWHEIAFELIEA